MRAKTGSDRSSRQADDQRSGWRTRLARLTAVASLLATSMVGVGVVSTGIAGATGSTGSISGTVTEPDGSPAAGVGISFSSSIGGTYNTSTASDGTYSLTGMSPTSALEPYVFVVVPPGDSVVYDFYNHPVLPTGLAAGQNLTGENTQLVASGSVSGTVSAHGSPLAFADVQVRDPNNNPNGTPPQGGSTTDSNGNYTVTGLAPGGPYVAQFSATGFLDMYWNDTPISTYATPVAITSGGTTTGIDASMITPSTVSGTVRDTSGNPVAGAEIYLENLDQNIFTLGDTTTASDGTYSFTQVVPTSYYVYVTPAGSALENTTRPNPITVGREASVVDINVTVPPVDSTTTGSAHGKVVDANGNPIAGAQLEIDSASGAQQPGGGLKFYTATTGADGTYNLTGIDEDSYTAFVRGPSDANGFPIYGLYSLSGDLSNLGWNTNGSIYIAGGQATQIDASLIKNAIFKGTITDNLGNPIGPSQVSAAIEDVSGGGIVNIDEVLNGTWELFVPAGTYKIVFNSGAWHDSYVEQWWKNAATEGAATTLTVTAGQVTNNMNVVLQSNTPVTVPGAPTGVSAVAGNGQATVSWTAPSSTGGAAITGYTVTPFKAGVAQTPIVVSGTGTSKVVSGLTNGTSYTFTVAATNSVGTGAVSTASAAVTPAVPSRTANQSFVVAAYTDFLGRAPTAGELSLWSARLDGGASRNSLITTLASSPEWVTAIVTRFYLDTLGRQPDPSGLHYWISEITSGKVSVAGAAASFYASPEYFAGFGQSSVTTWIGDLYTKILHRNVDAGGLSYWKSLEAAKGRTTVAYAIYQSVESRSDRVVELYSELLHRTPDQAGETYWVGLLPTLGDIALARNLADSAEYFAVAHTRFP